MDKKNVIVQAVNEVVTYEEVIDYDGQDWVALGGVTFKKDFGPFKAEEEIAGLDFRWESGLIHETDENGDKCGREAKFTMTIIPTV